MNAEEFEQANAGCPMGRRTVLGAAGAGLGALALTPGIASAQDRHARGRRPDGDDPTPVGRPATRFGRMFRQLPPFAEPTHELVDALHQLGQPGGIMDAGDDLSAGALALGTDPALQVDNPDNEASVAGNTFVGQFIDHDLTRDAGSPLGRPLPLRRSVNLRTPAFDLDSVYGGGPADSPHLYADGRRLLVESGGLFEDLPRHDDATAIIADPRNDENLVVGGLHAALLRFHNAVADRMADRPFGEIQRVVRWHWQWLVVGEFLPAFVGQAMVDRVLAEGPRFYNDPEGRIPVEFQTAAYRFGHSLVRPSYLANNTGDDGAPFGGLVFDPAEEGSEDPQDLRGGARAPRRFVDWELFFDFGDGSVQRPKRTDTRLSSVLFDLPVQTIDAPRGEPVGPTSLATRNLLRHLTWQVPAGQRIAEAMRVPTLAPADLADLEQFGNGLARRTPLWFYVLREAELAAGGAHLGPVGGRIVAEVFIGLLRRDRRSWLRAQPGWHPTLPTADTASGFRMTDLLRMAGVDPASRAR